MTGLFRCGMCGVRWDHPSVHAHCSGPRPAPPGPLVCQTHGSWQHCMCLEVFARMPIPGGQRFWLARPDVARRNVERMAAGAVAEYVVDRVDGYDGLYMKHGQRGETMWARIQAALDATW